METQSTKGFGAEGFRRRRKRLCLWAGEKLILRNLVLIFCSEQRFGILNSERELKQ